MRKVRMNKDDFELFHQDINPLEFDFFRSHIGTFKRMWLEQTREFWRLFVKTFDKFLWNYGILKDFPMTVEETHTHVDEIVLYIKTQFVDGKVSTAKALMMDCVVVTQNRHCILLLDKGNYTQNPFFVKETREVFRKLFGAPDEHRTYFKLLCGLQVYIKFAGAVVVMLRRWMDSEEIDPDDERSKVEYMSQLQQRGSDVVRRMMERMWGERDVMKLIKDLKPPTNTIVKDLGSEEDPKKKKKKKKKTKSPSECKTEIKSRDTPTSLDSSVKMSQSVCRSDKEESKGVGDLAVSEPLSDGVFKEKEESRSFDQPTCTETVSEHVQLLDSPTTSDSSREGLVSTSWLSSDQAEDYTPSAATCVDVGTGSHEQGRVPHQLKENLSVTNKESDHVTSKANERSDHETTKANECSDHVTSKANECSDHVTSKANECSDHVTTKANERSDHVTTKANECSDHVTTKANECSDHVTSENKENGFSSEKIEEKFHVVTNRADRSEVCEGGVDHVTSHSEDVINHDATVEGKEAETADVLETNKITLEGLVQNGARDDSDPSTNTLSTELPVRSEGAGGKKRLHVCHYCGLEETVAKNFKRCQKCRGRVNPSYYCSKECQSKHWKTHKLEHRSEPNVTG